MRALNLLIILYVLATTTVFLFKKPPHKNINIYYFINSLIVIWAFIPFFKEMTTPLLLTLYDWSPLIFLPLLHQQTALLTASFWPQNFDQNFIRIENKYFPSVMRFHAEDKGSSIVLSEYLHICYFSFYVIIYGIPLYFYLKKEYFIFHETVFCMLLLLFFCYFTHGLVPVNGPRNIFPKINDHRSKGFFFRLVHRVLEKGSTLGTAFPSGHTGVACVILYLTFFLHSSVFYWILPFALGLVISTIYGRFHYVTDVLAGIVYAILAFGVTIWIY